MSTRKSDYSKPEEPPEITAHRKQGSPWLWSQYEPPNFEPTQGTIGVLSCYRYASSSIEDDVITEELGEEDVETWLRTPVPVKNGENPSEGYKILHLVDREDWKLPMKRGTFLAVMDVFKLPPVEWYKSAFRQGAFGMFSQDDGSFVLVNRKAMLPLSASSILRYDPDTNLTMGYIMSNEMFLEALNFFKELHYQYLACAHPLLIPVSIMEINLEHIVLAMEETNDTLSTIEHETGFSAGGLRERKDRDYQLLVRKLGEAHSYYLTCQTTVRTIELTARGYLKHLDCLDRALPEDMREKLKRPTLKVRERLEFVLSGAEHGIIHRNMGARLQAQQAVLFNLIAQEDTRISIELSKDSKELAAASKQDSSAMKIIAFLTTLFLPGTFVATFFAMPLFDWEAPSIKQATTQHFWFYWAITGPLTLATMIIVLSWAAWQRSQSRSMALKARKSVGSKGDSSGDSEEDSEDGADNGEKNPSIKDIPTEEKMLESGKERFVGLLRKRRWKRRGFLSREMDLRGIGV